MGRSRNESSAVRRQLADDWTARYNTTPVLIVTFGETPRFHLRRLQGTGLAPCRNHVGARGYDHDKWYDKPKKEIWIRTLGKDWRRIFNR